jgi:hypothetical protein
MKRKRRKRKIFNKAQIETAAKGCENIGTMLFGGILLQLFLGKHIPGIVESTVGIGAAGLCFIGAIWLRSDDT